MEEEQKQYRRKWNCLFFYWMKGGLVYNPRKKSSDFMAKRKGISGTKSGMTSAH